MRLLIAIIALAIVAIILTGNWGCASKKVLPTVVEPSPDPEPKDPRLWTEKPTPVIPEEKFPQIQVKDGDTLYDLSGLHLQDPMKWILIWRVNRDYVYDPDIIDVGEHLWLPKKWNAKEDQLALEMFNGFYPDTTDG